jgi:DNA gyrase subunit A
MKEEYKLILENENIKKIDYVKNMKQYFLDYAMSVLIGRALPDVRDGLKPVHRRILYAMEELKLYPDKGYRKCARVVGDVLGKYHPHSDTSVYDALVRMAQDFSMRMVLVDGHGNFGSIDGDGASAMRYTESKMSKIAIEMLRDINKNTVDFMPNFDGEEQEPVVLPSRYPNLLVNGSSGIAVGFSTEIPSHNLYDVIEQTIYQIDNPSCTIEDLVNILKAPDFNAGGYIVNPQDMVKMYTDGEGKVIMRGKYHIEDDDKIVFTEIPYGVNKQNLMITLLRLKDGYIKVTKEGNKKKETFIKPKIPQITKLHDLSDGKTGIKIEITVDSKHNIDKILKLLFQNSDLQCNFSAIFTAVKDDKLFRKLSLKDINKYYIEHQKDVIKRRSQFDLDKALDKYILPLRNTIEDVIVGQRNVIKRLVMGLFGVGQRDFYADAVRFCQQRVKSDPLTVTTNGLILIHLVYSGLASAITPAFRFCFSR